MNEELGLQLGLSDMLQHCTVQSMASFIENPTVNKAGVNLDLQAVVDMNSLCKAPLDIHLRAFWCSFQLSSCIWRRNRVLLTGATGYFGAFILKELLQSTEVCF
ncbi:hypothetical protein Cfor_02619 [Coptotermes formosanus]|uniref:Thioester reductase (TE) domain-containing protein n=1 Tax=Coptotermes formosanus TaxID=36987 RepID=A0A6L2PG86_COPFO|nr:hypothetical protein Cfor_02619 [Coptotermes formosanus]